VLQPAAIDEAQVVTKSVGAAYHLGTSANRISTLGPCLDGRC
jgi:hypothetical protein